MVTYGIGGLLPHLIDPIPPKGRDAAEGGIVPLAETAAQCRFLQIREMELEQFAFLEVQDKAEDSSGPQVGWGVRSGDLEMEVSIVMEVPQ